MWTRFILIEHITGKVIHAVPMGSGWVKMRKQEYRETVHRHWQSILLDYRPVVYRGHRVVLVFVTGAP